MGWGRAHAGKIVLELVDEMGVGSIINQSHSFGSNLAIFSRNHEDIYVVFLDVVISL